MECPHCVPNIEKKTYSNIYMSIAAYAIVKCLPKKVKPDYEKQTRDHFKLLMAELLHTSNFLGEKCVEAEPPTKKKTYKRVSSSRLPEIIDIIQSGINSHADTSSIKIFNSINPYDFAQVTTQKSWHKLSYRSQYNCMARIFIKFHKYYETVLLFPELSDKGRLHFHGIIFYKFPKNHFMLMEQLNALLSNVRCSTSKNTRAVTVEPYSISFLNNMDDDCNQKNRIRGIDYLTKDIFYMRDLNFNPIIINSFISKKHIVIDKKKPIDFSFSNLDRGISG